MVFTKKEIAFALSSACLAVTYTWAEDAPKHPPAVTIVGHYDNGIGTSDASSQGAVTSVLLESRPALRTGELLEFVPGMIVTQHSGDGKANQYFLRGFNLDHGTDFATFIDGMPINMRTHAHGQGYTDLNFLIPELIDRIDYKKGPYFADEADFASAGAAHMRFSNILPQGIASLALGPNDYMRALLANSFAVGGGNLLYGLDLSRNNGPWETPEREKKYSGMLRFSKGTRADGVDITAMAYSNRWNSTDQVPLRAVQSGLISSYGAIDPTDGGNTSRYSLSYGMHTRNDQGAFELKAYAVKSNLDLYSNFGYFLDNPVDGDQFHQNEHRRMIGVDASQTWFARVAGVDAQNKFGIQARYDKLSPIGLYSTVNRQLLSTTSESQVKELSVGLFGENKIQWTDKFRTVAGVRLDHYRFHVNSNIVGNSGNTSDRIVSPKLSLIFGPWAATEFFVNYGKGFHSNDARGTTQTRLPDGNPATPVTPLVRTRGGELGIRSDIVPGLQSSLAIWRLDIDSELVFVGDAGETVPSRASRRQGIELNNHYVATPRLIFDLDLSASRARYTQDDLVGNYIPGSIDKVASFGMTVNDLGRWQAGFQLRYFGPRPLIEDNSVRSRSTTLAYARLGYKLDKDTKITLDVFNLLDRRASDIDYYYPSRLNGEAANGVNDIHFHPVEPRTIRLTVTRYF